MAVLLFCVEKPWFCPEEEASMMSQRPFPIGKKKTQQIAFYTWESIWFCCCRGQMLWVITEDVCVCAASVLKNELQKVIQYRKASKKRNAGGQQPTFSKDLKVRKEDFIHFYLCLHTSSQTNTLLITFIVNSYCKCRKTHCFVDACWLMFPPSIHVLSNRDTLLQRWQL